MNICLAMFCFKEVALRYRVRVGFGVRGAMGVGIGVRRWGCLGFICVWRVGFILFSWVVLWFA